MAFLSKRLLDHLRNPKRKIARYNRETYRAMLAMDIHACTECDGYETRSEICRDVNEAPILHETFCSMYPSLANIELEHRLEESNSWYNSKWDKNSLTNHQVHEAFLKRRADAPKTPEEWLKRAMAGRSK